MSILLICLIGSLAGAENWEEIYYYALGQQEWLKQYVDLSRGMPSRQIIERVMSILPTKTMERLLSDCSALIVKATGEGVEKDVISFDGKTMRGSRGWEEGERALHILHAWSYNHRLCLGQVVVDEKSTEITAIPKLIDLLELKGAIVTTDALNTQKNVASAIVDKGAGYVLPVKGNHPGLLEDIELLFKEADACGFRGLDAAQFDTLEKSAGRVAERHYALLDGLDLSSLKEWQGACCVGRVIRRRTKGKKTSLETTYYITGLDFDIQGFSHAARSHWNVENGLHWSLDVVFREDDHRYQDKVGAANLSALRKTALNILSRDKSIKKGRRTKIMLFASASHFRDHVLKNCF